MAMSTPPVYAEKDDPIYSGKFVVSSMKYRRKENGSNKAHNRNLGGSSSEVRSRTDIHHFGKKSGKTEKDLARNQKEVQAYKNYRQDVEQVSTC